MLHSFPKFDVHACLNATLHRFGPTFDNATINVLLDVGDAEVFNRTYPIGKIEKECVRVKKVIDICADFSDLNITKTDFSTCVSPHLHSPCHHPAL